MVALIVQRIDARLKEIHKMLQSDRSEVEACLQSRAVYRLRDPDVSYEAVIDFDSFFFESRSAYEMNCRVSRTIFQSDSWKAARFRI